MVGSVAEEYAESNNIDFESIENWDNRYNLTSDNSEDDEDNSDDDEQNDQSSSNTTADNSSSTSNSVNVTTTDSTLYDKELPNTGKVMLAWIIAVVAISTIVAHIRYKKLYIK